MEGFAKVDSRVVRNSHGTWMWLCFAAEVAVHAWRQVGEVIGSWLSPLPCIPETFVIVSPFASGMIRSTAQTRRAIVRRCGIACFVAQSAGICLPARGFG